MGAHVRPVRAPRQPSDRRRRRSRARDRPWLQRGHERRPYPLAHSGRGPDHDRHHPGGHAVTRILIVEDEVGLLRALGINLRARHYTVDTAADGASALIAASRKPPDLVILDLGLPDLDGVEVIRGLRGWSTAPIIVLSARDAQTDKVDALDAGADDYVTKP